MTPTKRPLRSPKQVLTLTASKRPSVPYKPTLHMFKGSNLDFNPATGLGHSYAWYEISRMITPEIGGKPTLVLNTFAYSPTTVRHFSRLRQLFRLLGLRFIEIQAPAGLQNLDRAADESARQWATECIRREFARDKSPKHERSLKRVMDTTFALGGTCSQPLQAFLDDAARERLARLERSRTKRATARSALLTTNASDNMQRETAPHALKAVQS